MYASNAFCQNNDSLCNGYIHSGSSIPSIKSVLIKSNSEKNLFTLNSFRTVRLTKFYLAVENPLNTVEEKTEKSQTKYDWLYFIGTAVAAVIVYFAWPEKAPESKQTLTFGKPLPPR
jgi:hypothetical protein